MVEATPKRQMGHVPALDGIRGAALVCMIFYHSGFAWLPGGIFSVSTFLTLSGYLVASLLLAERESTGRVDVVGFYERRLRRLLPAAVLTVIGGMVIGIVLKVPGNPSTLRWDAISAAGFFTNWRFVFGARSYADLFGSPTPFLHFWSLAIEVQYYLVAPLLITAVLWLGRGRRRALVIALALVAAASVALSILLFHPGVDNGRIYYGADTRAAEFAIGALAGVLMLPRGARSRRPAAGRPLAALGFAALAGLVLLERFGSLADAWVYRGGFAFNAAVTSVLIFTVVRGAPGISQVMAVRPLARFGEISYAAYLYHWPIFLILTADRIHLTGWVLLAVRMAVVVPLAWASSNLYELPIRKGRLVPRTATWTTAPIAVGVAVALVVGVTAVAPEPPPAAAATASTSATGPRLVAPTTSSATGAGSTPTTGAPADTTYRVASVGDAGGTALAGALVAWGAKDGRLAIGSPQPWTCTPGGTAAGACAWATRWPAQVSDEHARMLVVSVDDWDDAAVTAGLGTPPAPGPDLQPWLVDHLRTAVRAVVAAGATVVWLPMPDLSGAALKRRLDPNVAALLAAFETVFTSTDGARYVEVDAEYSGQVHDTGTPSDPAAAVAAIAGPRLAAVAQSSIPGIPRVLVVGDSVARSIGTGLESWGTATGRASVWDVSRDGCGIMTDGEIQGLYAGTGPLPAECSVAAAHWADQVRDFKPDVVVVASTIWDLSDRKVDGWPSLEHPGDARFDAHMLAAYRNLVGELTAGGARVVWLTAPCANPDSGGLPFGAPKTRTAFELSRFVHLNTVILPQVVASSGGKVTVADLAAVACPGGRFTDRIGPVDQGRPDGLHFSAAGSRWLADTYAARWLGLSGG